MPLAKLDKSVMHGGLTWLVDGKFWPSSKLNNRETRPACACTPSIVLGSVGICILSWEHIAIHYACVPSIVNSFPNIHVNLLLHIRYHGTNRIPHPKLINLMRNEYRSSMSEHLIEVWIILSYCYWREIELMCFK